MDRYIAYKEVNRAIQSIQDSTDKRVSLRDETYLFHNMCSPYVAHKNVEITYGHGVPRLIKINNDNSCIVIVDYDNSTEDRRIMRIQYPAFRIKQILNELDIPSPEWLKDVVTVCCADKFTGFDDEGNPIFDNTLESSVVYSNMEGADTKIVFTLNTDCQ